MSMKRLQGSMAVRCAARKVAAVAWHQIKPIYAMTD